MAGDERAVRAEQADQASGVRAMARTLGNGERTMPVALTALRVMFGLLWLQGAGWKVPPDFTALRNQTVKAIDHEVFAPWSWFVEHVVLEHFSVFGWLTLLTEAGLGALLVIGLCTRAASLAGAALSLVIALSVLDSPGEWGWSYWMLIVGHLLLAATSPVSTFGLDRLAVLDRARGDGGAAATGAGLGPQGPQTPDGPSGPEMRRVPAIVCGGIVALGVYGLIASHTVGFTADRGRIILLRNDDWFMGDLVQLNGLGALLYTVVAAIGLVGVIRRDRALVTSSAGAFVLLAVQVLVQFGRDTNWLGAQRGGNLAVCAAGALVLGRTPGAPAWLRRATGLPASTRASA